MRRQFGWLLCLALAAWANPALAGAKAIDATKGAEVKGNVTADDPKVNFDFMGKGIPMAAKEFAVKFDGGKSYSISLFTEDMGYDPFLIIQDKDGKQLAFDDDGGGKLNSLLAFTPPAAGTYKVFAASLGDRPGNFTLKITPGGAAGGDGKELAVGKGLRLTGALNAVQKEIVYNVKMEAGKSYRIDHMSGAFDCFLEVRTKDGKVLADDDDGGDGLNSRIVFRAPENGVYRIVATSLGRRGSGNFVLEVREE